MVVSDNILQLLVAAKTIKGTTFIRLNNYTSAKSGEVSHQTILGGISLDNAKLHDFQTLLDNEKNVLENEDLIKEFGSELVSKGYFELLSSLEKRLSSPEVKEQLRLENDPTINRSDAQNDAYIHLTKGVKLHKETKEIHIFGLQVRKETVTKGTYDPDTRRPLTKCKDEIQRMLKLRMLKFRTLKFSQANVKLQGIEITNK